MEVDVLPRKGKGKGKSGKGKKGGKKGKESHSGKGHGESKVEHTRFDGECRNCENTATKRRIVGTSNNTSLMAKAKARASRNPKSQRSAKATRANKLKRHGHQTLLLNRRLCLK